MTLVVVTAVVVIAHREYRRQQHWAALALKLQTVQPLRRAQWIDCEQVRATSPVVLLVIGQSNAANHGLRPPGSSATVMLMQQDRCAAYGDPLPGGTGNGGSFISRLPAALQAAGLRRPVVAVNLALDATSIDDWTHSASPLRRQLADTLTAALQAGFKPDLVLWQQGETDARLGTSVEHYAAGLQLLIANLRAAGVQAPVIAARSTVCRNGPSAVVRSAIERLATSPKANGMVLGPDTDKLSPEAFRFDGCHFTAAGLDALAQLWAEAVVKNLGSATGSVAPAGYGPTPSRP